MAKAKHKKINLALQGGGSHGAVTWGVVDRLLEDDRLEIEAISGSSAGAVNASAIAYGLHKGGRDGARETLNHLWKRISDVGRQYSPLKGHPLLASTGANDFINAFSSQMLDVMTRTLSPYQFNPFDINPLRDILEEVIDFKSLRHCEVTKLFVAATNVRSGKVHVFETKDISTDVVCASTCLPLLFKAVEVDGEHYWDGGYMGNPVLFPFFYEADSSDILIVHVNPIERNDVPTTAPEIMNRMNEITFNSSLLRELRAIGFIHKLLDDGWIKDEYRSQLRDIRIHSIRSDQALKGLDANSKLNTDERFLLELKQQGRDIAEGWLEKHFNKIGEKSTVDLRQMFSNNR